jgi:hypothetical protein
MALCGAVVRPLPAEDIIIRAIEAKNGKPAARVRISFWSWEFGRNPAGTRNQHGITDARGRVVFHVDSMLPTLAVGTAEIGCSQRDYPASEVLKSGIVGENNCVKKSPKDQEINAKPGEIVFFMEWDSFWKRLHRNVP